MSKDGNDAGRKIFIQWLKSINKNINIHNVDVSGHLDGYIFLVRPGLLMTWLAPSKLPEYFKNWDKVYIDNDTNRVLSHLGQHRYKRYHPVIAQEFYNFLQTNTEETFYNINSLSINENTVLFTGKHKRLFNQLEKHGVDCWLVNTGWVGGKYGQGERCDIKATKKIVEEIHNGNLKNAEFQDFDVFNLQIPKEIEGVDTKILNPRNCWEEKDEYELMLRNLAILFLKNMEKYEKSDLFSNMISL